jgi:putative FmdB family regulatory protein
MRYTFKCAKCKRTEDIILPVSEMDVPQTCPKCSADMVRVFNPGKVTLFMRGSYKLADQDVMLAPGESDIGRSRPKGKSRDNYKAIRRPAHAR